MAEEDLTIRASFLDEARRPLSELERQARQTGRAFDEMAVEAEAASVALDHAANKSKRATEEMRGVEARMEAQRIAATKLAAAENALTSARSKGPLAAKETARLEGAVFAARTGLERATRSLRSETGRLGQETESLGARFMRAVGSVNLLKVAFSGLGLVSIVGLFTSAGAAIGALGAAAIAAVAGLAPLAGLLGGLPAVIGGMMAVVGATKILTAGLGNVFQLLTSNTATAAQMDQAMQALGPNAQVLVRAMIPVAQQFKSIRSEMQQAAYPAFARALTALHPIISVIGNGMVMLSSAIGRAAEAGANMVSSGPWRHDAQTFFTRTVKLFQTAVQIFFSFADAIRHITMAAGPMVQMLAEAVAQWATNIDQWLEGERASGKLEAFFTRVGKLALEVAHVIGDFASGLFAIFKGASPLASHMGGQLLQIADHFKEWANSAGGQASISKWFHDAIPVFDALMRLIGALGKAILQLTSSGSSAGIVGIINGLTNMIPGMTKVLELLTKIAGAPGIRNITGPLAAYTLLRSKMGAGVLPSAGDLASGVLGGAWKMAGGVFGMGTGGATSAGGLRGASKIGIGVGRRLGIAGAESAAGGEALGGLGGLMAGEAAVPVVGWIALAATVLATAGVILYKKWKPFHDLVNKIGHAIGEAFQWAWDRVLKPFFEWLGHNWRKVLSLVLILMGPIGLAVDLIWHHWKGFLKAVETVWHWLGRVWKIIEPGAKLIGEALVKPFQDLWDLVKAVYNSVKWIVDHAHILSDAFKHIPGHGLITSAAHFVGLYTGGPVAAGTPYVVGERGPELFYTAGAMRVVGGDGAELLTSRTPGFVLPNESLQAIQNQSVRAEAVRAVPFAGAGAAAAVNVPVDGVGALPPIHIGPVYAQQDVDVERAVERAIGRYFQARARRR